LRITVSNTLYLNRFYALCTIYRVLNNAADSYARFDCDLQLAAFVYAHRRKQKQEFKTKITKI